MDNDSRTPDGKALTRRPDQSVALPSAQSGTGRSLPRVSSVDPEAEYDAIRDAIAEFANPTKGKENQSRVVRPTTKPQPIPAIVRLGSAALLLGFALGGFFILPLYVAVLWLVFLIVAFPIGLAYMSHSQALGRDDLLTLYMTGVRQLPVIGRLLSGVFPSVKKND